MGDRAHRVAALDLGTNSFHLVVAEISPDGAMRTVAREKVMLRLGDEVGATGRIGADATRRALDAVTTLAEVARAQGATQIVACATAAVREAENGSALATALGEAAGCPVEVISGEQEARLIFRAVQASVDFDAKVALGIDIGGGSVEFAVGDQQSMLWAASLPIGVGRLTARFVDADPLPKKARRALDEHVRHHLDPIATEAALHEPTLAVGTSGTLLTFARIAAARAGDEPSSYDGYRIDRGLMGEIAAELIGSDAAARARMPGLDDRRIDLMPAAAVLVAAILDVFDVAGMVVSTWGLREGILLRETAHPALARTDPRRTRRRTVLALGRRHRIDELHGRQTARLAGTLFDSLAADLGIDPQWRDLLEDAALIHDVGTQIALKGHDRHGAYLVRHGELAGFEPAERQMLECLVRYHRAGTPKRTNSDIAALPEHLRPLVRPLVSILRLADGLDRSRTGNVLGLDVRVDQRDIVVRLTSTVGDAGLDLWGGRRKAELLEKVSGRRVHVLGPDELLSRSR